MPMLLLTLAQTKCQCFYLALNQTDANASTQVEMDFTMFAMVHACSMFYRSINESYAHNLG